MVNISSNVSRPSIPPPTRGAARLSGVRTQQDLSSVPGWVSVREHVYAAKRRETQLRHRDTRYLSGGIHKLSIPSVPHTLVITVH